MPKFAVLDFKLKSGRPQGFGEKGMPVFAKEEDILAPPAISEVIPGKLYLSDVKTAVEWVKEIIVNPAAQAVIVNIGCNYADFGVTDSEKESLLRAGRLCLIDLPDGGSINPFANNDFDKQFEFIDSHIKQGKQVLIHCASGASRSPTIVTAYLMRKYGLTFESALYHVGACRPLAEPSSFKEHLEAYQQALAIAEPFTFPDFLKQHRTRLLLVGLGLLAITCLIALSIVFPPAFLIGLVGAGILGSGGALASSISLGSLSALALLGVIGGGIAVTAVILFSLLTFGVYRAEAKSRQVLLNQAATAVSTTKVSTASNAATAVSNAPGSSAAPVEDADANGALVTSKSPLAPPQPSGTILGTSSTAPGTNTVSGQGVASSAPPATIKL